MRSKALSFDELHYDTRPFIALCDHNPVKLQTDRRTDGWTDVMLVA